MEWKNLKKVLPGVDIPFYEDNPKVKEKTAQVMYPYLMCTFFWQSINMVIICFQVGRFLVPCRFFSHLLDLWVIFRKEKPTSRKTFVRFSQSAQWLQNVFCHLLFSQKSFSKDMFITWKNWATMLVYSSSRLWSQEKCKKISSLEYFVYLMYYTPLD